MDVLVTAGPKGKDDDDDAAMDEADVFKELETMDAGEVAALARKSKKAASKRAASESGGAEIPAPPDPPQEGRRKKRGKPSKYSFMQKLAALLFGRLCDLCGCKDSMHVCVVCFLLCCL